MVVIKVYVGLYGAVCGAYRSLDGAVYVHKGLGRASPGLIYGL